MKNLLVVAFLSGSWGARTTVLWSSVKGRYNSNSEVTVPAGEEWILDENMDVGTLTIQGKFSWHIARRNLELRSFYILVDRAGSFNLGSENEPMELDATIFIKTPSNWDPRKSEGWDNFPYHPKIGSRFFAGVGGSSVEIYGRTLERTWTLLSKDQGKWDNHLWLKHSAESMGWRIGDKIAIATTNRGSSTEHRIVGIDENGITIDPQTEHNHMGGIRDVFGVPVEKAAEVINLSRNVKITGDTDKFHSIKQGWHTGAFWEDDDLPTIHVIKFAELDHCGQNDVLGRYCFHFHLVGKCPGCVYEGNSVYNSVQAAFTIHGSHQTKLHRNVLWNPKSVGIYTEDGNEMNNTISENVIICENIMKCGWAQGNNWQDQNGLKEGGIYFQGMTNDLIGNHVAGMEHGFWSPGSGNGRGFATGKTCNTHQPFGRFEDNVWHDNQRFGIYLDNQYSRDLQRDDQAHVLKSNYGMESCNAFTRPDGKDNGFVSVIKNDFNYHNMFVGGYAFGDIEFDGLKSVNNINNGYWKRSKNFVEKGRYHVKNSFFLADPNDNIGSATTLFPGGSFTFKMKDTKYAGWGSLQVPQHCGIYFHNPHNNFGSTCAVQYLFENVDFSELTGNYFHFGPSDGNPMSPTFIASDNSIDGHKQVISGRLNGFLKVPNCSGPVKKYGDGIVCEGQNIRRMVIFSPNMGDTIKITGPGYDVSPNWDHPVGGTNAGNIWYDKTHGGSGWVDHKYTNGYGMHVVLGETYRISSLMWKDDIFFQLSDPDLADALGNEDEYVNLELELEGFVESCRLSVRDSRDWHNADGVAADAEISECSQAFRTLGELVTGTQKTTTTTKAPTTPPPTGDCSKCGGAEWDVRCEHGGTGCNACGIRYCRFCGGSPPYDFACPTQAPTTTQSTTTQTGTGSSSTMTSESTTTRTTTTTTTKPQEYDCKQVCGGNTFYDERCWTSSDPHGGLGCNACNKPKCRICGGYPYIDCP